MIDMGYIHGIEKAKEFARDMLHDKNIQAEEVYARLKPYHEMKWSEMNGVQISDFHSLSRELHGLCEQVNVLYDLIQKLRDEITAVEQSEKEAV